MGRHQISRKLTRAIGAVLLFGISYVVSAVMNAATISHPAFVAPQSNRVVVVIAPPAGPGTALVADDRMPATPLTAPRYEDILAQPAAVATHSPSALPL
jgi:hypothetical protein